MDKRITETNGNANSTIAAQMVKLNYVASGKHILCDINLDIKAGEMTAIIGRTGSGKSTLLRMLNRLSDPTSGDVSVLGENVKNWDVRRLRKTACLIPQNFSMSNQTVREILVTTSQIIGKVYNEEEISLLLEKTELKSDILNRRTSDISGGERQRVAICRTLLANPKILLADEPTANLDRASARVIAKILMGFVDEGKTVIWVTHDPDLVSAYAKNGVLMKDGEIVGTGEIGCLVEMKEYNQ